MGHVACMRKTGNIYKIFLEHKGGRVLERSRSRCEDNIKMQLIEVGCKFVDSI